MARFQINPAADGALEFEMIAEEGGASLKTRLSAQEGQDLVDLLGAARMVTPGAVAVTPAEGVVQAVVDPAWIAPPFKAPQGRVLVVRHPGFGWIHFIFPDERAEQVARALAADPQPVVPPSVN